MRKLKVLIGGWNHFGFPFLLDKFKGNFERVEEEACNSFGVWRNLIIGHFFYYLIMELFFVI
jgi:hypothetical protein